MCVEAAARTTERRPGWRCLCLHLSITRSFAVHFWQQFLLNVCNKTTSSPTNSYHRMADHSDCIVHATTTADMVLNYRLDPSTNASLMCNFLPDIYFIEALYDTLQPTFSSIYNWIYIVQTTRIPCGNSFLTVNVPVCITQNVDYCYRREMCVSVSWHTSESCKNVWTDRDWEYDGMTYAVAASVLGGGDAGYRYHYCNN